MSTAADQKLQNFACDELETTNFCLRRARTDKMSPLRARNDKNSAAAGQKLEYFNCGRPETTKFRHDGQKRYNFDCDGPETTKIRLRRARNAKISAAAG